MLNAFYDLALGPISFDFMTFLIKAMKARDELGEDGLHVVIVPKEDGLGGFARHWGEHDEAATRWRLWHIVISACPLARATVTLAHTRDQAQGIANGVGTRWWPEGKAHFPGELVDAAKKGQKIPLLCATEAARRYVDRWLPADAPKKIVTLTVRNQSTSPDRNSDLAAWIEFRDWLLGKNYRVIWIQDAHEALGVGIGYAELDPDLRLALYQRAAMNCICNNGPQDLMKYSDAPYMAFGVAITAGWQDHFRKHFHMEPGEQMPWATPQQRIVYQPDNFANLKAEFEKWQGL